MGRCSLYADLGHVVWNRAYSQHDFFSWMLKQTKSTLHVFAGKHRHRQGEEHLSEADADGGIFGVRVGEERRDHFHGEAPRLHRHDAGYVPGAVQQAAKRACGGAVEQMVGPPGKSDGGIASMETMAEEAQSVPEKSAGADPSFSVYPHRATADNINLQLVGAGDAPVEVRMFDQPGKGTIQQCI